MCYNIFVPENLWISGDLTKVRGVFLIFKNPEQKKLSPMKNRAKYRNLCGVKLSTFSLKSGGWTGRLGRAILKLEGNNMPEKEKTIEKKYTIEEIERACRLFLQDAWNDQSETQALSPEGEEIIWGGIIGEEITKNWLKFKEKLEHYVHK